MQFTSTATLPFRLAAALLFSSAFFQVGTAQKVTMEKVAAQCQSVPFEQRIRLSVTRFSVSTRSAEQEFGGELATMLTNALQEVNCFRVLESVINMKDMTSEITLGQEGFTTAGSSPQSGKMLGSQVVVTGEVTEFAEGNNSVKVLGLGGTAAKAHIGFILKVINPETREIVFSRSIDVDGKANGFSGATLPFGVQVGGTRKGNVALTDAIEKGVIMAVEVLANNKDNFGITPNSGKPETKDWNASNCLLTRGGRSPKVMIIIPESHLSKRIPDPAGETEMIKKFIKAGIKVVDPATYAAIRGQAIVKEALQDPSVAASLGVKYGADIVVVGEAFSELVNRNSAGMVTSRARVEARAVRTSDGTILAADGQHAGAAEVAESTSSKAALRNAGGLLADAFLASLCTGGAAGNKANSAHNSAAVTNVANAGAAGAPDAGKTSTTQIRISGTSFTDVNELYAAVKKVSTVTGVERKFSGSKGTLTVQHTGSADDLLNAIASDLGDKFVVTNVGDGVIGMKTK